MTFTKTDLYDNYQKEGYISCKVDLMDLQHRGAQTENQSPNNDLDCLREKEVLIEFEVHFNSDPLCTVCIIAEDCLFLSL